MPKKGRWALAAVLLVAFAFRGLFIAQDMRALVTRGPLYDDSFYSFEIARNIARGLGSTFDGVTPTNGYQPLYVFLLVPVYAAAGDHATLPIYIALLGSALCNVLTGLILFRLVRTYASVRAAFFGLVLWSFGPAIVRQAVNGLETSLATLLVVASVEYYLRVFRRAVQPSRRQALTLGILLGLSVFARVDALLLVAALGIDAFLRRRPHELRALAWTAGAALVVMLPWCIGSQALFGSPLPDSGRATRFLSEAYAPHDHPQFTAASFAGGPPLSYLLENLSRSCLQLGTSPVLHVFTRGLERTMMAAQLGSGSTLYAVGSLLALAGLGIWLLVRRSARHARNVTSDFGFLFLYSALLMAAYSFVIFGQIFYSRYYYPIFFFSIVLGALAFDVLVGLITSRRARRVTAIACTAAYAVVLCFMSLHRVQNGNYRFLHVVDWIAARTEPGARIGVFNSGAIGYFSDRHIVNLDGKVNPQALAALRAGAICDYIEAEGLEYVIDHEWILRHFLLDGPAAPRCIHFARVDGAEALGVPGWAAYRVVREATTQGPGGPSVASRLSP